jgi:hypothetical protein
MLRSFGRDMHIDIQPRGELISQQRKFEREGLYKKQRPRGGPRPMFTSAECIRHDPTPKGFSLSGPSWD